MLARPASAQVVLGVYNGGYPTQQPDPSHAPGGAGFPQPDSRTLEEAVDRLPPGWLQLSETTRWRMRVGPKTLADRLPILTGSYSLVLDYTSPDLNHLYMLDRRDGGVVARYVANGGRENSTPGTMHRIRSLLVRPTWRPTMSELEEAPFAADGPGPTCSMGLVKLNLIGAVYLHGVGDVQLGADPRGLAPITFAGLGTAISHGCVNMSNPNVVELVERFGIGIGTPLRILRDNPADALEARGLEDEMMAQLLGDRRLSDGLDLLEADFAGAGRYLSRTPYQDIQGNLMPDDHWYLLLWKRRRDAGM